MRIDRVDSEAELLGTPASSAEIVKVIAGDFEVRLANSAAEVEAAQALRFRVFFEEMAARPPHAATSMSSTRSAIICWCSTGVAARDPRVSSGLTG